MNFSQHSYTQKEQLHQSEDSQMWRKPSMKKKLIDWQFSRAVRSFLAWLWLMTEHPTNTQICIAYSVKNMSLAIYIFLIWLLIATYISLLSTAGVLVGALLLLFKLIACANMADCRPQCALGVGWQFVSAVSFTCRQGAAAIVLSLSGFLLRPTCSSKLLAGWHASVMPRSPTAIYLHLCTFWNWQHPHFASDPSINSWVSGYLAVAVTFVYSYTLK